MEKIPVNIISGFLGSGKTTAIAKLLDIKADDEHWAVIVNEFGKVSIDGQMLRATSDAGSIFDISGGCICCSAKGNFSENLNAIIHSGNYSRIIIEPSGLGGIDLVSEIVEANPSLILMPVICLVDLTTINNSRLQMSPIYQMQIRKADLIVFSKTDLVADQTEQDQLIEKFKVSFPNKQHFIKASKNLLNSLSIREELHNNSVHKCSQLSRINPDLTDRNYQEMYYPFDEDCVFNPQKLVAFIDRNPSIVRAKGFIQTQTGWNLFHFTLSGSFFEPCQPHSQNELVVITEKSGSYLIENHYAEIENSIKETMVRRF